MSGFENYSIQTVDASNFSVLRKNLKVWHLEKKYVITLTQTKRAVNEAQFTVLEICPTICNWIKLNLSSINYGSLSKFYHKK